MLRHQLPPRIPPPRVPPPRVPPPRVPPPRVPPPRVPPPRVPPPRVPPPRVPPPRVPPPRVPPLRVPPPRVPPLRVPPLRVSSATGSSVTGSSATGSDPATTSVMSCSPPFHDHSVLSQYPSRNRIATARLGAFLPQSRRRPTADPALCNELLRRRGPSQMRQRSNAPGPLDVRHGWPGRNTSYGDRGEPSALGEQVVLPGTSHANTPGGTAADGLTASVRVAVPLRLIHAAAGQCVRGPGILLDRLGQLDGDRSAGAGRAWAGMHHGQGGADRMDHQRKPSTVHRLASSKSTTAAW